MKLKPIVPLMSLIFAATLTGCNFDGSSDDSASGSSDGGTGTVPTALSSDAYWNIGGTAALSGVSTYSEDLPNVHVFDGDKQYYYDDDDNFGTYTIKEHSLEENIEAGTLRFTHYDASGPTEVDGEYQISGDTLSIDTAGAFGVLTASDKSEDPSIKDAVTKANEAAGITVSNKVAQLLDTTTGDSGELRVKFADSSTAVGVETIASGKVKFDLTYQLDEDTAQVDTGTGDSIYISLYNADGTSNSNLHTGIILTKGMIEYRTADGKSIVEGSFAEAEKLAIEITWSPSGAIFTINGTEFTVESYGPSNPVAVFSVKLGDTSDTTQYELLIDNLELYSNSNAVFSDNFEGYAEGHVLSDDPYNDNTFEATVINEAATSSDDSTDNGTDTGGETDNGSDTAITENFDSYQTDTNISVASSNWREYNSLGDGKSTLSFVGISSEQANSGNNSLLISDLDDNNKPSAALEFNGSHITGSVSVDVYVPSGNTKDTYINIGNGKNSADRYFEVRMNDGNLTIAGDNEVKIPDAVPVDTWTTVSFDWDNGNINTSVNGAVVNTMAHTETGFADDVIPSQLTLYVGNDGDASSKAYYDNISSDLF